LQHAGHLTPTTTDGTKHHRKYQELRKLVGNTTKTTMKAHDKFFFFFSFSNSTTNIFSGIAHVGPKPTWAVLPLEEQSPKKKKKKKVKN
jgi:hypothetical protein